MAKPVQVSVVPDQFSAMLDEYTKNIQPRVNKAITQKVFRDRIANLVATFILLALAATALAFSVQQMKLLNTPATKVIVGVTAVILAVLASTFINQAGEVGIAVHSRYRA
jgi:small neutral amino acid transporter SnatA (MarC family)